MITARALVQRLDLRRAGNGWRGQCPSCEYATSFSVRAARDGRALLYCANCQDQDGVGAAAARVMGEPHRPPPRPPIGIVTSDRARREHAAAAMWQRAVPARGTLADTYLSARGLPGLAASPALRFLAACRHPEGSTYPAMVAAITSPIGAVPAVHRTFLAPDGTRKASVEPSRATLGPMWGGTIRLANPTDDGWLVIGEGIETAGAAGELLGFPAWAAGSAGNLAKGVMLPASIRRVMIAADPDPPGEQAAREAALRWSREGREVRIARPRGSGDFNDVLRQRRAS